MGRMSTCNERIGVADADADDAFRRALSTAGIERGIEWAESYVEYEWNRSRHLLASVLGDDLTGRRALEVGCYVGGTAVVMAALGAEVVGIDVDDRWTRLAELNARRYGLASTTEFRRVDDLGALPFESGSFDVISCNSVLEYLDEDLQHRLLQEIDRVLCDGGVVMVLGTSNRLWPRENHSARWLVNYLPQDLAFPRTQGAWCARAVWPWRLTRAFRNYREVLCEGGRSSPYVRAKERMHLPRWRTTLLRLAAGGASVVGVPLGMLGPTVTLALRKPSRAAL
jgi:SAM-dependent methyltransferase